MDRIKNMTLKQKIISAIVLVFLLAVGTTLVLNFTLSSDDVNTFYGIKLEDETLDNLELTNIKITEEEGITSYEATVKAESEIDVNYIEIKIKDEKEEEILTLIGYVGASMKKNDERKIRASTDADLKNIKSIDYKVIEKVNE